ncbi:sugar transferase [Lutimaribacter marinistellae]|uniref:Sugar transferase n=1 Tax=Lutimaribacter marinistellae TaxID=1820329 RepID=A0ABV7TFD4_9RHOB
MKDQTPKLVRPATPHAFSGLLHLSHWQYEQVAVVPERNTLPYLGEDAADTMASSGFYSGFVKRVLDILFVILSLPVALPIILLCALALYLEGGRPFYTQPRLGRGGRRFSIYKLRTMITNADETLERILREDPVLRAEWESTQKLKNDPRITPVGDFLRKTSLDELPQLWNVLTGEMSIVGPRPMLPQQLPLYRTPETYFSLRPGITGLWQVSARNEKGFGYRAEVDAEYLHKLNLGTDLSILVQTVGVVLRQTGY